MILVEDGAIRLDEPVDRLLPELADRRVLRSLESGLDDTVPARRPILVEDLLTLRMGFGSILAEAGRYPIQRAEAALGLATLGSRHPAAGARRRRVDRRPRDAAADRQPGERWLYNTGSQVLGVLIERAAGGRWRTSCGSGCSSRWGWSTPVSCSGRNSRNASPPDTARIRPVAGPRSRIRRWAATGAPDRSAGRRLVAAVHRRRSVGVRPDAAGRRARPGGRVLSEASVEAMTTDHIPPSSRAGSGISWRSTRLGVRDAGSGGR